MYHKEHRYSKNNIFFLKQGPRTERKIKSTGPNHLFNNCCDDAIFGSLIPSTRDRNGGINYCVSIIKIKDKSWL